MDMHHLVGSLTDLSQKLADIRVMLRLQEKEKKIDVLTAQSSTPEFWSNQEQATAISKQLGSLQEEVHQWNLLQKQVEDLKEMAELDEMQQDVSLHDDLESQYQAVKHQVEQLEFFTLFSGSYDESNAIVSIYAGSGGTEAHDWAQMLLRMLFRFCERKGFVVTLLDETIGTEAGIKSVSFRVVGRYAFGYLQSEHGTHRLVRISPFDAEQMRHTSFAGIEVIPEIEQAALLEIDEKDLRVDTFMSGGKGGQSVNTTYSAVRIVHIPTGITVQCQNERSQLQNRETAMKILRSRLQLLKDEEEQKQRNELRGEHKSAEWGNQIRSYVLHPYKMVKDVRTRYETTDPEAVLNGELEPFMEAYLRWKKSGVSTHSTDVIDTV